MVGHRVMAVSLATTGAFTEGRVHYDQAISVYDPQEHRVLATRFSVDVGVTSLMLSILDSLGTWVSGRCARETLTMR